MSTELSIAWHLIAYVLIGVGAIGETLPLGGIGFKSGWGEGKAIKPLRSNSSETLSASRDNPQ